MGPSSRAEVWQAQRASLGNLKSTAKLIRRLPHWIPQYVTIVSFCAGRVDSDHETHETLRRRKSNHSPLNLMLSHTEKQQLTEESGFVS